MTESLSTEPDADWERIAPLLDDALCELSDSDRDAIFLRYFERKSANEMAKTLGISDEAAQKNVLIVPWIGCVIFSQNVM